MKNQPKTYSFAIIITLIIIIGCSPDVVPLQGEYTTSPFEITSTRSIDSIWANLRDLFVTNGLPVKSIDKQKGIIVSAKTSFIPVYTFEDNNGQLQGPRAWVVLPRVAVSKKEWNPKAIYGQWSIQVTEQEKGETKIKVGPVVACTYFPNRFTSVEVQGQSTGKLEELIRGFIDNSAK